MSEPMHFRGIPIVWVPSIDEEDRWLELQSPDLDTELECFADTELEDAT